MEHPNKQKYPDQRIYLIAYRNYIYVVPFVKSDNEEQIFLKTVYPSREYTKRYLAGEE